MGAARCLLPSSPDPNHPFMRHQGCLAAKRGMLVPKELGNSKYARNRISNCSRLRGGSPTGGVGTGPRATVHRDRRTAGDARVPATLQYQPELPMDSRILVVRAVRLLLGSGHMDGSAPNGPALDARLLGISGRPEQLWLEPGGLGEHGRILRRCQLRRRLLR